MVLPNPATACLGVHRLTRSHPSGPLLAGPSHTCSRENSREGEPSVLPSAVLESPGRGEACHVTPIHANPHPTTPDPIYSPKRAAVGAEAPSAAVCSPCPAGPRSAVPSRVMPSLATPHHIWTYTVRMPAVNRPCLGRQSPRPTSLPASVAISSMSRRLSTSGSN